MNICFVTGYVGYSDNWESSPGIVGINIPKVPVEYDSYFITNIKEIIPKLKDSGWIPILINLDESKDVDKLDKIDKQIYFTIESKKLKVFPHSFISKVYDYVVWFDNKFNVNVPDTIKTIEDKSFNFPITVRPHPFISNIKDEFKIGSSIFERYRRHHNRYIKYIDEEVKSGLSQTYSEHYQTGYIIYDMNHPKVYDIQNLWMEHIHRSGIHCQVSFNFIIQKFKGLIGSVNYNYWDTSNNLMIVAHPDDESVFGGGVLIKNPHTGFGSKERDKEHWKIICLTNKNNKIRSLEFKRAMEFLNIEDYELWDFIDSETIEWTEKEVSEISNRLENIIQEKEYDAIFTHSLEGEYGHQQHKHIHKIVKNLVNKNLFVFGNGDSKLNKNILLKKLELLKIYNSQPIMKYPIFFPWVYNERSNQIC